MKVIVTNVEALKMKIHINRWYNSDCVLGRLSYSHFKCFTLELPFNNNEPNISCIPNGTYRAFKRVSPKNGLVLELRDVPGRTFIQIHAGNYTRQIQGCILVGDGIKYLDNDNVPDITNSKLTLNQLLDVVPDEVDVVIE